MFKSSYQSTFLYSWKFLHASFYLVTLWSYHVILVGAFSSKSFYSINNSQKCWKHENLVFDQNPTILLSCNSSFEGNSLFWGEPRTKDEIVSFVSKQIFGSDRGNDMVDVVSVEPPLIYVTNFIDSSMCDEIIQTAKLKGLDRSKVGSEQNTEDIRTSQQTWLRENDDSLSKITKDRLSKVLRNIASKVSRITGLPPDHQENLQVVKYEKCQKFDIHLDHLEDFNELECRGRLATCLIYLNDGNGTDFGGGETFFPEFEFKASPKKGSAIFWWNTVERPGEAKYDANMFLHSDMRMRHSGLEIDNGEKWICNRWIHPIPLKTGVVGE